MDSKLSIFSAISDNGENFLSASSQAPSEKGSTLKEKNLLPTQGEHNHFRRGRNHLPPCFP